MTTLKGFQKKYLRGLAHAMKPIILIGQKGLADTVFASIDDALKTHELIKIKFNEFKEKDVKTEMINSIAETTHCEIAGQIGHTVIVYRQNEDPDQRVIQVPS